MSQATSQAIAPVIPPTSGDLASTSTSKFAAEMQEMWKLANCAVQGGFAPRGLETREKAFAAMAFGHELGFPPMASLRCIGVVNGKPGLYAEGILAVIHKSGQLERQDERFEGEGEKFAAVCVVQRAGRPAIECRYSVADAIRANLWKKQGPWTTSPKDMLMWKARHRAVKATFADLLMGVDAVEDLREIEPQSPRSSATTTTVTSGEPHTQADRLNADLLGSDPVPEGAENHAVNAELTEDEKAQILADEAAAAERERQAK